MDNPALHLAGKAGSVLPVYILDPSKGFGAGGIGKAQHWWLRESLISLKRGLASIGLKLHVFYGDEFTILKKLVARTFATGIYWNRGYEPERIQRDKMLKAYFCEGDVDVRSFPAALLFEPWEILNRQGSHFKVFTPFWKHCLQQGNVSDPLGIPDGATGFAGDVDIPTFDIESVDFGCEKWTAGFGKSFQPGEENARKRLDDFLASGLSNYSKGRNFPASTGVSRLSPHIRFGEISVREIVQKVDNIKNDEIQEDAACFLGEIGWREFSYYLLYHFPRLRDGNFKPEFDRLPWGRENLAFKRWTKGLTGIPLVDAGMRELWHTGYMHNRVRMVVASFLTKNLLLDWRLGRDWFEQTLLDADVANNSAGWQWVAGCGADAAPFFRIFNPVLQAGKFDPQAKYIRKWIPELENAETKDIVDGAFGKLVKFGYPEPVVDLSESRQAALAALQLTKST